MGYDELYSAVVGVSQRLRDINDKYPEYVVVPMKVFRLLDRIANPWKKTRANWLRRKR